MKPRLLLYCCKAKPYLYKTDDTMIEKMDGDYHTQLNKAVLNDNCLNGKIVAECDYDVENINTWKCPNIDGGYPIYRTKTLSHAKIREKSGLTDSQLEEYFGYDNGYAIHIKNLHIFNEPKELSEYFTEAKQMNTLDGYSWVCESIDRAPQNMMYAYANEVNKYIVISIQSQWLCKILNGEKTIEVRKKILKEML